MKFIEDEIERVRMQANDSSPMGHHYWVRLRTLEWVLEQLKKPCIHGDHDNQQEGLFHLITREEFEEFKCQASSHIANLRTDMKLLKSRNKGNDQSLLKALGGIEQRLACLERNVIAKSTGLVKFDDWCPICGKMMAKGICGDCRAES